MPRRYSLYLWPIPFSTRRQNFLGKASLVLIMRTVPLLVPIAFFLYANPILANSAIPAFKECHTPVTAPKRTVNVRLSTAESRRYASDIKYAAKQPVNFAGHYILASWGCGAGCVMGGAIDAISGNIVMLPFTVSDWPLDITEPLAFKKDSCLLVVHGSRNEEGHGIYYYRFIKNKFELFKSVDR